MKRRITLTLAAVLAVGLIAASSAGAAGFPTVVEVETPFTPVGAAVKIRGTNFKGTTAVKFGATNASSFTVGPSIYEGKEQITAVAPAGKTGERVDVTVTTPEGTSAIGQGVQFTWVYYNAPCWSQYNATNFAAVSPAPHVSPGGGTLEVSYDVHHEAGVESLPTRINLFNGPTMIASALNVTPEPGTNHSRWVFTGLTPGTHLQALEFGLVMGPNGMWGGEGGCEQQSAEPMPGTLIAGNGAAPLRAR